MRFVRSALLVIAVVSTSALRAQTSVPTRTQSLPPQTLSPGGGAVTIELRNYFSVPGLVGTQFAQFDTILGRFNVELRDDAAPRHVANFLAYVQASAYSSTFIHRSSSFDSGGVSIVQGGGYGYRLPTTVYEVSKFAPVALEYNLPNERGTLAAARTSDVNSATSEWYFNVRDNSTILNQSNGGGYSVFARVIGTGMTVVDQIAALPRYNAGGAFGEIPLRNFSGGNIAEANLVVVNAVRQVSLFPSAGGGDSVLTITAESSAPSIVSTAVTGTSLKLTPLNPGSATVTVRVTDTNNNTSEGTFTVTVAAGAPAFVIQPSSQTVTAGSTVVFNATANGATSYRWERNGAALPNATSATLVLNNVAAANAGDYVAFATNSVGSVQSATAKLTVSNLSATDVGRLINLSILTSAGSGERVLTMGAVVGPFGATGALPVVIRAVGPTLARAPFNVSGVLPDPVMTFFSGGSATPIDSNDNWGGSATLINAFRSVGAFELPADSLDSAFARTTPGIAPGGYTVQVTGKNDATGLVIAEVYDASGTTRTATTPRLINLSTRAQIDAGADLAVGFVVGGQSSRTVLVRGVGPSLSAFGVTGLLADPQLELFNGASQKISGNDDWAGNADVASVSVRVGAFALVGDTSKDAALLVTLPPGAYSARLSGVGGTGGAALVEVYEVP